jgi:hypothetical protein
MGAAGTTIVNQVENVYNPGAAAHTRPIGGTGFRGDEGGLPCVPLHGLAQRRPIGAAISGDGFAERGVGVSR